MNNFTFLHKNTSPKQRFFFWILVIRYLRIFQFKIINLVKTQTSSLLSNIVFFNNQLFQFHICTFFKLKTGTSLKSWIIFHYNFRKLQFLSIWKVNSSRIQCTIIRYRIIKNFNICNLIIVKTSSNQTLRLNNNDIFLHNIRYSLKT